MDSNSGQNGSSKGKGLKLATEAQTTKRGPSGLSARTPFDDKSCKLFLTSATKSLTTEKSIPEKATHLSQKQVQKVDVEHILEMRMFPQRTRRRRNY